MKKEILILSIVLSLNATESLESVSSEHNKSFPIDCSKIKRNNNNAIYALALHGGGIRGVILTTILEEIEKQMEKPINQIFDLIVGTSTGGILSLGLSLSTGIDDDKFSAKSACEQYEKEGEKIFSKKSFFYLKGSIIRCFGYRYSHKPLKKILKEKFKEKTMENCKTNIAITAVDTSNSTLRLFRSWEKNNEHLSFIKVARATSAAPTFFKPIRMLDTDGKKHTYSDGGTYANNPALKAFDIIYNEFRNNHSSYNNQKPVVLISINTGIEPDEESKDIGNQTILSQVKTIIETSMKAQDIETNEHLKILSTVFNLFTFYSLRIPISSDIKEMDKVENVSKLKEKAEKYISESSSVFKQMIKTLKGENEPLVEEDDGFFKIVLYLSEAEIEWFFNIFQYLHSIKSELQFKNNILISELQNMDFMHFPSGSYIQENPHECRIDFRYPLENAQSQKESLLTHYKGIFKKFQNDKDVLDAFLRINSYTIEIEKYRFNPSANLPFLIMILKEAIIVAIRLKEYCDKNKDDYKKHLSWIHLCLKYNLILKSYNKGLRSQPRNITNGGAISVSVGDETVIHRPFIETIVPSSFETYLTKLHHTLLTVKTAEKKVVVIHGENGVGKSTLTKKFIEMANETGAYDMIVWLNAENEEYIKLKFLEAIRKLEFHATAQKIETQPSTITNQSKLNEISKRLHDLLELQIKRFTLFIFANASSYEEIRQYIPNTGHTIITTQIDPQDKNISLKLENFSHSESIEFLKKQFPDIEWNETFFAEIIDDLYNVSNYNPLALSSFCNYVKRILQHQIIKMYDIKTWLNFSQSISGFKTIMNSETSQQLVNSFESSYSSLTPSEKKLFNFLCFFNTEIISFSGIISLFFDNDESLPIDQETAKSLIKKYLVFSKHSQIDISTLSVYPLHKRLCLLKMETEKIVLTDFSKLFINAFNKIYKNMEDPEKKRSLLSNYYDAVDLSITFNEFMQPEERTIETYGIFWTQLENIFKKMQTSSKLLAFWSNFSYIPIFIIGEIGKKMIDDCTEDQKRSCIKKCLIMEFSIPESIYNQYEEKSLLIFSNFMTSDPYECMRSLLTVNSRWIDFIDFIEKHEELFKKINLDQFKNILFDSYIYNFKDFFKKQKVKESQTSLKSELLKNKKETQTQISTEINNFSEQEANNLLSDILKYLYAVSQNNKDLLNFNTKQQDLVYFELLKHDWFFPI